jgi:HK97 family phage major capsid protein
MAYNKAGRERMGKLSHDMHAILDKAKRQGRGLTSAEREQYHNMTEEFSALEMSVLSEHSGDIVARMAQPNDGRGRGGPAINALGIEEMRDTFRTSRHDQRFRTPHDNAFTNYLRKTEQGLTPDERELVVSGGGFQNTTSTTTGSQGGYVVPTGFSDKLMEALRWFGGIEGVVDSFTTETGQPLPYPTNDDTVNKGRIIGQNAQVTQTDPTFGQVTFQAYIFSSDITLIPRALLEDSYFDLDALLARMLGTRIGRLLNNKCTVGSGTGEPTGIVTASVTAGNVTTLASGNTASIAYSNLVGIEHTVDPAYRYNPSTHWMFSDSMLKLLKLLVDGNGRPLWQPGLTASFGDGAAVDLLAAKPTILSHPYIVNQDMAVPTANAYSLLFGDMSKYKLRKVGGIQVQRLLERYADYLQVGFIAWLRADGQLVDANLVASQGPIAVMQQSAS